MTDHPGTSVHIDQVIVDQELLESGGLAEFKATLSTELSRLLAGEGVHRGLLGATVQSKAAPITRLPAASPESLAHHLAGVVHGLLSSGGKP